MSNIVPYRIQLDIKEVSSQLSLSVALGDTGRKLIIQLVDDGKEFELGRGTYAVFTALKPDGNTLYNDCTIQDNQIIYNFTEQTTSCEGITDCQIVLYDATGYLVTAPRFAVIVYDAIRSRVDIQSASENLAIDEIAEQEAYRQLQEAKRQDNEASRVINEETRTINEAYRIASGNVIRAFLGGYNLPSLESPMDVLMVIDMNLANVKTNNYFTCKDEFIRGIAIVGNTPTEGDITTIDTIEPHKIYRYKGLRFVPVTIDVPESSVLDDIFEMVEQAVQSAKQAEMWAENANTIVTQKPTVYFESDFKNLIENVSRGSLRARDIFILTASDQPDFVVLDDYASVDASDVVYITRNEIPNNIPQPQVGKIYQIEGIDNKLIAIESGIQTPAIDSDLNDTSTNPVQNKVIALALKELEDKIGIGGSNITVEQELNDSKNPISSKAVNNAFQNFSSAYMDMVMALTVKYQPINNNDIITVENNKDYHASVDISNLNIQIPSGNIICSVMFKTADDGILSIRIDGAKGYIGKPPDFDENGVTWEVSIHNGIVAAGKVVSAE